MTNLLKRSPWAVPKHPMTQWVLGDELTWPAPEKLDNWKKTWLENQGHHLGVSWASFFWWVATAATTRFCPKIIIASPAQVPFPFPYSQMVLLMLSVYTLVTPVIASQLIDSSIMATLATC